MCEVELYAMELLNVKKETRDFSGGASWQR